MDGRGRRRRHRRMRCAAWTPSYGRGALARPLAPAAHDGPRVEPRPGLADPALEVSEEEELRMLEEEEMMMNQELEDLSKAIEDLRTKEKKEVNK